MSTAIQQTPAEQTGSKLYALIGLMVVLWSGNYIVAKVALREIPATLLICIRMAMSGTIMLPFLWKELQTKPQSYTAKQLGIYSVLGLGGVMLNQFFFVLGISRTTVTHSSMLIATTPVWVLLIAGILGTEKITVPKLAGMGLAIAGVAILQVFRPKYSLHGPTVAGDLMILLAAVLLAVMTAFGKRFNPGRNAIVVNSIGYIGGGLLLAPVAWWVTRSFDLRQISLMGWLGVLYMAAFSSVLCYLIYYWALERIPASRVATFQYLQPFLATLMAVCLLGEELTVPAVLSGGIIFSGVFLTERFG